MLLMLMLTQKWCLMMTNNPVAALMRGEDADTGSPELNAVLRRAGERLRNLPTDLAQKLFETAPKDREFVLREAVEQIVLEMDLFMMKRGVDLADHE